MEKQLISLVRQSIEQGYLPANWHKKKNYIIETATDYLALSTDCVDINGMYYHEKLDGEHFVLDEINKEYIHEADSIHVYKGVDDYFYTHQDNSERYFQYWNNYYSYEGMQANDLVLTVDENVAHIDSVHYWESDGAYHHEPEYDEDEDSKIWGYHDGPCPPDYRTNKDEPGIGFEIEKGRKPVFCGFGDREWLFEETGCVMEEDGTVDWELKTPVYPLFSDKIENYWLPKIEAAINADDHEQAGGHIHLSMPPKIGCQLFDYCRPYLPLFMAMYPRRLETDYCKGKPELRLKKDDDKHQAVKIWNDRIELRFPAKVYNMKAIVFRLNFCRQMIKRKYTNIPSVVMAAFDTRTELGKLVSEEYHNREALLLQRVLEVAKKYFGTNLLREKNIEILFANLKKEKSCVLSY